MKQGIGSTATFNIIIIFIVIVFGLLAATISYYKAFKVNSMILYSIDKFEGYNDFAKKEIRSNLNTIGYTVNTGNNRCDTVRGKSELVSNQDNQYLYCVYYYADDRGKGDSKLTNQDSEPIYYNYSVVTYIYIDLPIVGNFKVPVHTKGERIYNFSSHK